MTIELLTLVALALLCLLLPAVYGPARSRQVGMAGLLGNRDDLPPPEGLAGRGLRAHQNLIENLVPYAAVVLTAQALDISNGMTRVGAVVFLVARLVHAASYLAGVTILRTLAYGVGVVATLLILIQLF
jgi:uncharacterized MAPEG superfamily protein